MAISPLRHMPIFNPANFGDRQISVIGAGATGSRVALQLAKLGITNIEVHDFDIVEKHNIANQLFTLADIGEHKVVALQKLILAQTGTRIKVNKERVTAKSKLEGEVIYLLTDTMDSRKEIWESGIKMNLSRKLLIETRMGVDNGRVYSVVPFSLPHIRAWEETLKGKITATSACGTSVTVGPTADVLAGIAVWQFIKWFSISQGKDGVELENEIIYSLRPMSVISRVF